MKGSTVPLKVTSEALSEDVSEVVLDWEVEVEEADDVVVESASAAVSSVAAIHNDRILRVDMCRKSKVVRRSRGY